MKKLSDYDPIMSDNGIDYVVASRSAGVSLQSITWAMSATGVFVFETEGLTDMANTSYQVMVMNQTSTVRPATVGSKTTSQFTITGPDAADSLDIWIVGQLENQKV